MKKIQILFITTWLFGCSTSVSVDTPKSQNFQEYYQFKLISGIKIPEKHKVLADPKKKPEDLIQKLIIELDKKECKEFYLINGFRTKKDPESSFGSHLFDSVYKLIPNKKDFIYKYGENYATNDFHEKYSVNYKQSSKWLYLIDTTTSRLYCLISYSSINGYVQ